MKKKLLGIVLGICVMFSLTSCEQTITKTYGDSMKLHLPAGEKLEEITWKYSFLWYLTRPMREGETAETHTFHESSDWGGLGRTVTIIETNK